MKLLNERKLFVAYMIKCDLDINNVKCSSCESVLSYCGTTTKMGYHINFKSSSADTMDNISFGIKTLFKFYQKQSYKLCSLGYIHVFQWTNELNPMILHFS
jgi:hypothetical protein